MTLEVTILSNLIYNEEYTRKVLPFLKQEYFTVRSYKVIFLEIHEYISNYNTLPCLNALGIECQERTDLSEEQFKEITEVLGGYPRKKATWIGLLIQRKSGVKREQSISRSWRVLRLLMAKTQRGIRGLFLLYYLMLWLYPLIIT